MREKQKVDNLPVGTHPLDLGHVSDVDDDLVYNPAAPPTISTSGLGCLRGLNTHSVSKDGWGCCEAVNFFFIFIFVKLALYGVRIQCRPLFIIKNWQTLCST